MSAPRYAKRVDDNHARIVAVLQGIGVGVVDMSGAGDGMSDLLCAKAGVVYLVEVKDGDKSPSRRKLTPKQVQLHDMLRQHGVTVHVVTNEAEALAVFGARFSA